MKDYISTLQSQIARNSVEITDIESLLRITKDELRDAKDYYTQEHTKHSDSRNAGRYLSNVSAQVQNSKRNLTLIKKTLKKLVENQKTLKKLKTQLVILDNLYGEEDW